MSQDVNKVILVGRLGADAELKHVNNGANTVASFRIATTDDYKPKDGGEAHVEWSQCSLWGKRAEGLSQFLTKGSKVYVEGKLRTRSYEKDGQKRYVTEINVDDVKLLGSKPTGDGGERSAPPKQGGRNAETDYAAPAPPSDDIPW